MKKFAIASDHAGYAWKEAVKAAFVGRVEFLDLGTHSEESTNYADYGLQLGAAISEGRAEWGIAICGSGIGISIAVNRYAAVRAALCTNPEMAKLSRLHNNANVLVLGSRIMDFEVAKECIESFLATEFEGGRHEVRISKLKKGI